MNLLMQAVALAAQDAVPVLHTQRCAGEDVMLGDGQVEDFIGFEERREDGPALQHHAAHLHFAEELGIRQDDLGVLGERGGLNAGAMEAAAGFVAAYISDNDALGPRLPALAHHLGDNVGIGVGGLLRSAVPGDVGLDDDHVLAADEAANAAEIFERLSHERVRLAVLDHGEMRPLQTLRIGRDAMVAARLLGLRRLRTEAVLAEPDGRARSSCRHTAHAQQLQQSLAAREALRGALHLFRLAIGFRGHGNPPS